MLYHRKSRAVQYSLQNLCRWFSITTQHNVQIMTPGVLLPNNEDDDSRPSKRIKWAPLPSEEDFIPADAIPSHPLGVKPAGNAYTSSINSKSNAGVFAQLPDELLMQLLEALGARQLLVLGATCKALYAFTRAEELWRALFVE
jgi:hypothetical protein